MPNLEARIEATLLFKNEPVSVSELSKWLGEKPAAVKEALENLRAFYQNRGVAIVFDGESAAFGTHPETSALIETLQKEEFSRELGRAGLETLSIVLYRGPVSRREIDHIRGVNSGFILRSLLIRGLVERSEEGRSHIYKPTIKLLQYLGVNRREDLPEFETAFKKIMEFQSTNDTNSTNDNE